MTLQNRLKIAALCGLAAAVLFLWKCPVWWIWGIPCPGCQFTRALLALLQGNLSGSLHLHAMVIPTLLAFVLLAAKPAWRKRILVVWAVCMLAYWLVRLPFLAGNPDALIRKIW